MPNATGLNIIFAGTPEFAAHHLKALINSRHNVVGTYTQPDRPAGRGKKLTASPVKAAALEAEIPVFQPLTLKEPADQKTLAEQQPDIMVVVAYGLLLPKAVLEIPRLGCINVHASLLPRWRGAAPIQRAIEAGDIVSGITIMQMDEGLDTGDMLYTSECPIHPTDTASMLHDRLMGVGPRALLATLDQIQSGHVHPVEQDSQLATYAHKLTKQEAQINWQNSATDIVRIIHAFNPFPMAYTYLGQQRLRVLNAQAHATTHQAAAGTILSASGELLIACGQQTAIAITELQLPGKKAMDTQTALNGFAALFEAQHLLPSTASTQ